MKKVVSRLFIGYDWIMLLSVAFLVLFGLIIIYSTSLDETGITRFDKQVIFFLFGLLIVVFVSRIDYRWFGSYAWVLYIVSIILLGAVLIFGTNIRGTTGWFVIGSLSFQPIELVKVFIIIILARILAREPRPGISTWLRSLLIIIPVILLLYLQPDFGPIFLVGILWLLFNLLRGLSVKGWLVLAAGSAIICAGLWFGVLSLHQKDRIITFFYPNSDPQGSGFHVQQSMIAIGSGGLFGRGLGQGVQSQLHFLPEAPTDFVFASFLEQLGFTGFTFLLLIWIIFFWRAMRIIGRAQDNYTLYISLGITTMLFIQTAINIAMNIGLAPIVGLPLPFLSYGGSALLSSMFMVGILESIAIRQKIT